MVQTSWVEPDKFREIYNAAADTYARAIVHAVLAADPTLGPTYCSMFPKAQCLVTKANCKKNLDQQKQDFKDQQKAEKKAFDDQQKAQKDAFDAQNHTQAEKKAFADLQKDGQEGVRRPAESGREGVRRRAEARREGVRGAAGCGRARRSDRLLVRPARERWGLRPRRLVERTAADAHGCVRSVHAAGPFARPPREDRGAREPPLTLDQRHAEREPANRRAPVPRRPFEPRPHGPR